MTLTPELLAELVKRLREWGPLVCHQAADALYEVAEEMREAREHVHAVDEENHHLKLKLAVAEAELKDCDQKRRDFIMKYAADMDVKAAFILNALDLAEKFKAERDEFRRDAERYRWLRERDWYDSAISVIRFPKENARPGTECPTRENLDSLIDTALSEEKPK